MTDKPEMPDGIYAKRIKEGGMWCINASHVEYQSSTQYTLKSKADAIIEGQAYLNMQQDKRIAELEGALKFYANRKHIKPACGLNVNQPIHIDHVECGKIAKQALEKDNEVILSEGGGKDVQ